VPLIVIVLFCRFAFVIPALPLKLALVRFVIVLLAAFIILLVTTYPPFGVMYNVDKLGISDITNGLK
jgi:hypothetical protein